MKRFLIIAISLVISLVSVYSQERNIILPEKPTRAKFIDYSVKNTGWWIAAQLSGALATTSNNSKAGAYQVDIINGYRFSEFLKVGIGFSPRIYSSSVEFPRSDGKMIFGVYSLPIYADVRGNIISQEDRMFSFYWSADMGYTVNEGLFFSPGVGLRLGGIRHDMLLGLFYSLQEHRAEAYKGVLHMFGVRIGYEF